MEVQKECEDVPEVVCDGEKTRDQFFNVGRKCDPCPSHPVNVSKEVISCQEHSRPKRRIQVETKCREYNPPCGDGQSCDPQIVCYQKPLAVGRRSRQAPTSRICKKRIVVKKRRARACPCRRNGFLLPPRKVSPVTQKRVCHTTLMEKCDETQVQVCDKLPEESCQDGEKNKVILKCTGTVRIPDIHLL